MSSGLLEEIVAGHAPGIVPLTADQYHQMIRSGIIPEGTPLELIDGFLVWKDRSRTGGDPMGHDPRHALLIARIIRMLNANLFSSELHVRSQLPVTLDERHEPEPDVAIVRGSEEDYATRHPGPADVALVIEVSDSSLRYDRSSRLRVYARGGIPMYWIVNMRDGLLEVHERPDTAGEAYAGTVYKPCDVVPLRLGGRELVINLAELLA